MNTRARTAVQAMRKAPMLDKVKELKKEKKAEMQRSRLTDVGKLASPDRRQRKIALQQDVDKLRKKLRHEENVHRALERAFTRPLGALPRLPPYLPSHTLELLAEVAVLEEEVVRLEEQVVNFRQGLYLEAIYISYSSKKPVENVMDLYSNCFSSQTPKSIKQSKSHAQVLNSDASMPWCPNADPNEPSSNRFTNVKWTPKKLINEDHRGKENQSNVNSTKNKKQSPINKGSRTSTPVPAENRFSVKSECQAIDRERVERIFHSAEDAVREGFSDPNNLSEDLLKCLMSIFSCMGCPKKTATEMEMSPSVLQSSESTEDMNFRDPYGICLEFGSRNIGPYKHFYAVESSSIDPNLLARCSFLRRRLKVLLRKLGSVELLGMSHQQKLAFWINIYNSCMMNAFLEQGIPSSPDMVVALMPKVETKKMIFVIHM